MLRISGRQLRWNSRSSGEPRAVAACAPDSDVSDGRPGSTWELPGHPRATSPGPCPRSAAQRHSAALRCAQTGWPQLTTACHSPPQPQCCTRLHVVTRHCCLRRTFISWSRGVTASTLDSESSHRGSNPRETCARQLAAAMSRNVPGRSIADCLQACKQWPITCPGAPSGTCWSMRGMLTSNRCCSDSQTVGLVV